MIGCDIEKVARFEKLLNQTFLEKYFNLTEIEYINSKTNKTEILAGLYSAKEAILKALGLGIGSGKLDLKDICINHLKSGKPIVEITEKIKAQLLENNASKIDISISHTTENSFAVALLI